MLSRRARQPWAGVKVLMETTASNLVADPTAPITMQVYSEADPGSITALRPKQRSPSRCVFVECGLECGVYVQVTPPDGLDAHTIVRNWLVMGDLMKSRDVAPPADPLHRDR